MFRSLHEVSNAIFPLSFQLKQLALIHRHIRFQIGTALVAGTFSDCIINVGIMYHTWKRKSNPHKFLLEKVEY